MSPRGNAVPTGSVSSRKFPELQTMLELLESLLLLLGKGEKASLSTVTSREGSVPAPAGSRLLVSEKGTVWGTVGGGPLEAQVLQAAGRALQDQRPSITNHEFKAAEAAAGGMICGGRISLFTEVIFPTPEEIGIFKTLVDELKASRPVALATSVVTAYPQTSPDGTRLVFGREKILAGSLADKQWNDKLLCAAGSILEQKDPLYLGLESKPEGFPELEGFLVEVFHPDPTLVIFGAGHVAQPLCKMAAMAGFKVVVVDDRPEFASPERFPKAKEILLCDPEEAFTRIVPGAGHYLVSVTRGHLQDRQVIEHALKFPAAYIGMIGSKRKVKLLWEDLKTRGFEPEALERVHAPIGLEIGAETPAEIAVSILAEMIRTRRATGRPVIRRRALRL